MTYLLIKNEGAEGYGEPLTSFYRKNEALQQRDFLKEHGYASGFEVWELAEYPEKAKLVEWDE